MFFLSGWSVLVYMLLPVIKREMKEYLADRASGKLLEIGGIPLTVIDRSMNYSLRSPMSKVQGLCFRH